MGRILRNLAVLFCLVLPARALAQADIDGPDCGRPIQDFGDAPEGHPTIRGRFPTCLAATPAGNQQNACPPRSTPPGPTGYIKHEQGGDANYWLVLRCDSLLSGIDSEADGKFSSPGVGPSACDPMVLTDPLPSPPPITPVPGQDEYSSYDGDGGYFGDLFWPCYEEYLSFNTANCGPQRVTYLNVLVDMNLDGDWNDNSTCGAEMCAHEWAVKNHPVEILSGCQSHTTPTFRVGPDGGTAWVRISLTDGPVADDFPWAGSANQPGGAYSGGETEDFTIGLIHPDPVKPSSWGRIKLHYR